MLTKSIPLGRRDETVYRWNAGNYLGSHITCLSVAVLLIYCSVGSGYRYSPVVIFVSVRLSEGKHVLVHVRGNFEKPMLGVIIRVWPPLPRQRRFRQFDVSRIARVSICRGICHVRVMRDRVISWGVRTMRRRVGYEFVQYRSVVLLWETSSVELRGPSSLLLHFCRLQFGNTYMRRSSFSQGHSICTGEVSPTHHV